MKKLFISYKIAKQLKEKGFNEPCFRYYDHNNKSLNDSHSEEIQSPFTLKKFSGTSYLPAPTHQQVLDWFRDKHKLHFYIVPYGDTKKSWSLCNIGRTDKTTNDGRLQYAIRDKYADIKFKSYYSALNTAIKEALKLIK